MSTHARARAAHLHAGHQGTDQLPRVHGGGGPAGPRSGGGGGEEAQALLQVVRDLRPARVT